MLGSQHDSGRLPLPKRMNFRKSSRGGGFRTAFLKMYLVLIFINTIVEKHNLKRPLCINFMFKKPCLKFPKSAI